MALSSQPQDLFGDVLATQCGGDMNELSSNLHTFAVSIQETLQQLGRAKPRAIWAIRESALQHNAGVIVAPFQNVIIILLSSVALHFVPVYNDFFYLTMHAGGAHRQFDRVLAQSTAVAKKQMQCVRPTITPCPDQRIAHNIVSIGHYGSIAQGNGEPSPT